MYDVFVSHSKLDREFVIHEIVEFLEDNGISTWFDEDDIGSGEFWQEQIRDGLKAARCFLIVMSKNSVKSKWVQAEVHWAAEERLDQLVPVLIDDCDSIDFHLQLPRIQHIDFRVASDNSRVELLRAIRHKLGNREEDSSIALLETLDKRKNPKGQASWISKNQAIAIAFISVIVLFLAFFQPWNTHFGSEPESHISKDDGNPDETPYPKEQLEFKEVSVGTKDVFIYGQISILFQPEMGAPNSVNVIMFQTDSSPNKWTQKGIGPPKEFKFKGKSYLLHITEITPADHGLSAGKVKVAVVEKM